LFSKRLDSVPSRRTVGRLAPVALALITWLGDNVSDPSAFLAGVRPSFSDVALSTSADSCLDCLVAESEEEVGHHLPIIAAQVLLTSLRFFKLNVKDFLTGGRFSENVATHSLREETRSVLKTNRLPESVFGFTDWLFARAPNMSMLTREALVLVCKNKTFDWFDELSTKEQSNQWKLAKNRCLGLRLRYLQRKSTVLAKSPLSRSTVKSVYIVFTVHC
jgi:hypothetical protein